MNSLPAAVSSLGIAKFRKILDSVSDIEERDMKGCTALFRAARSGRHEHLRLLIERGANVNSTDTIGASPLQIAAYNGHLNCVEQLAIAGADLNYCSPINPLGRSQTALCWAVRRSPETAVLLLSLGANPNAGSSECHFPLITAIGWNQDETLLRALISVGADVNLRDAQGNSSLHSAVNVGSVSIIKLLLEVGADVNAEAEQQGSPLCLAILRNDPDSEALVIALLAAKPSLTCICRSWEMTPIELAHQLGKIGVCEVLLAAGSPPIRPDKDYSGAWEDEVTEIQTPQGRVRFEFHVGGTDIKPSAEDIALASDIWVKLPTLCQRFGWQGSPGHWAMLDGLQRCAAPTTLKRLAYFARGFRNAPISEEFTDGPSILGETYQDAITRLIEAGCASSLSCERAIFLSNTAGRFSTVAKANGLRASGTKSQLFDRLIRSLGLNRLLEDLPPEQYFEITVAGQASLVLRQTRLAELIAKLRSELLDLLNDGEFAWAAFVARDLDLMSSKTPRGCIWRNQISAAEGVSLSRQILAAAIPDHLDFFKASLPRHRLISAAAALVGGRENDWHDWDPMINELHSQYDQMIQKIDPAFFGQRLLDSSKYY